MAHGIFLTSFLLAALHCNACDIGVAQVGTTTFTEDKLKGHAMLPWDDFCWANSCTKITSVAEVCSKIGNFGDFWSPRHCVLIAQLEGITDKVVQFELNQYTLHSQENGLYGLNHISCKVAEPVDYSASTISPGTEKCEKAQCSEDSNEYAVASSCGWLAAKPDIRIGRLHLDFFQWLSSLDGNGNAQASYSILGNGKDCQAFSVETMSSITGCADPTMKQSTIKRFLWLFILLIVCCCFCCCAGGYVLMNGGLPKKGKRGINLSDAEEEEEEVEEEDSIE